MKGYGRVWRYEKDAEHLNSEVSQMGKKANLVLEDRVNDDDRYTKTT
jgi:hypothetical protein